MDAEDLRSTGDRPAGFGENPVQVFPFHAIDGGLELALAGWGIELTHAYDLFHTDDLTRAQHV